MKDGVIPGRSKAEGKGIHPHARRHRSPSLASLAGDDTRISPLPCGREGGAFHRQSARPPCPAARPAQCLIRRRLSLTPTLSRPGEGVSLARRLRIAGRRLGIGQWRETGDAAGDFLLGVFPPIVL
jgi:hypothetical protein